MAYLKDITTTVQAFTKDGAPNGAEHRLYDPDCPCGVRPWRNDELDVMGWVHPGPPDMTVVLFGKKIAAKKS